MSCHCGAAGFRCIEMESNIHPFDASACSNVNSAWAAVAVEVLLRLGVHAFVISPGSRSTPLTLAAARNPKAKTTVVLDERTAGFVALGMAKRSRRPTVLICTSGSALAQYYPAVVEAAMSATPLVILSADRPPELQDCGAGQTIDQLKFFGEYARAAVHLGLPECSAERLAYLRQSLLFAVEKSLRGPAGPVQVNVPFRLPLEPTLGAAVVAPEVLSAAATVITRSCEAVRQAGQLDLVAVERLASHRHGIIVVGDYNPTEGAHEFVGAISAIAQKLGWPILTDVLNPLRTHLSAPEGLIVHYHSWLSAASVSAELAAQVTAVLQVGALPTSKRLRQWLGDLNAPAFSLSPHVQNLDPLHRISCPLVGCAADLACALPQTDAQTDWIHGWQAPERWMAEQIDQSMRACDELFEGKVAWLLARTVPAAAQVFVASSMSVRYAEYFWSAGQRAVSIFANRGANGIDGTLGTAVGLAQDAEPCYLLTGDLAFLHDSNALLLAQQLRGNLTVILINNAGGGIFEHLPVAAIEPEFEQYFATPQVVNVKMLCAAHGIAHQAVDSWPQFEHLLEEPSPRGLRILELVSDRKADAQRLAAWQAAWLSDFEKRNFTS